MDKSKTSTTPLPAHMDRVHFFLNTSVID